MNEETIYSIFNEETIKDILKQILITGECQLKMESDGTIKIVNPFLGCNREENKINAIAQKILDDNSQLFKDLAIQEQKESLDAQLNEQVRANKMLVEKNRYLSEEVTRLNLKLQTIKEDLDNLLASVSRY